MDPLRQKGKTALETVLNNKNYVKNIENAIYKRCEDTEKLYTEIIYQIIGDIQSDESYTCVLKKIQDNNVGWDHPCYTEMKNRMIEQDDFIQNPIEIVEGVVQCKKLLENGKICGSKKVYSYSLQDRSCDEGMSTYSHCTTCGSKWVSKG